MSSFLERRSLRSVSFNNDKIQIQQQQQLQPSEQSPILQSPLIPNKKFTQVNKLPAINRSTIKYEFNAEGQEICNHHAFCSHLYEFNDQSAILYPLSQPLSIQSGAQLPPAREIDSRGVQEDNDSNNVKKMDNNNNNNKKSILSTDKNQMNNNSSIPAPSNNNRLKVTSSGSITEEALDDWIAQSQNRPIVSFLDPYKKFNVPDKLLVDFKNRYRKLFMSKERDFEKKLLYFEDRSKVSTIPHYQLPTRRPKEEEKSLTFRFKELQPKNINGTSIAVRENYQWKHITFKVKQEISNQIKNNNNFNGEKEKDKEDDYDQGVELSHVLRNISNNNSYHIKDQQHINRSRATRSYSHGIDNSISVINQQGEKSVRNTVDKSIDKGVSLNRSSIIGMLENDKTIGIINKGKVNKSMDRSSSNSNKKLNSKLDKRDQENDEEDDYQRSYDGIAERVVEQLKDEEDRIKKGMIVISATKNLEDISSSNSNTTTTSGGGFCGHIDCYLQVARIEKSDMNQVQFAFWKSIRRIQKQAYSQAISCLKETLEYDRLHFHGIFNLACIYEKLGFYDLGLTWFEIAKDIVDLQNQEQNKDSYAIDQSVSLFEQLRFQLVHYGIAICSYHLGSYQISLNHVNLVISAVGMSGNSSSKNNKKSYDNYNNQLSLSNDYIYSQYHRQIEQKYLRAVCYKQLKMESQAAQEYAMFQKDTCPKDFKILMRLMIAVVFKKRKDLEIHVSSKVLCDFQTLIQQILAQDSYTPALQPFWEDNQWVDMNYLLKRVRLMSFFCRFDEIELKSVIPYAKFNVIQKSTVIFPKNDQVMVITSGNVILQNHRLAIELPETIAYFNEGDIIGLPEKDNQLSVSPGLWLTAQTEIEILVFPKNIFMELWKKHALNETKTNQIFNVLVNHQLFIGIAELTLYKLAYELIEVCNFEEGEIIFCEGEIIEKQNGIKLTKGEKVNSQKPSQAERVANKRKQEFLKRKINGLYIIKKGICELDTAANWCEYKLKESDYFGESLMFDGLSVTQFGRITAKSKVVETFCLPRKAFASIPLPDQMIMQKNAMNSNKQTDYNRLISNLAKYKQQQLQQQMS